MKNNNNQINVFDVANYIINKLPDVTNMKLQKLIYYAHAHHLVKNKKKLIDATSQAWVYGPVFPELYQEFCKYSYLPVGLTSKGETNKLSLEQKEYIDYIIKLYGNKTSGDLSEQTHNEEPWLDANNISDDWEQNVITDKALIEYFSKNPISN